MGIPRDEENYTLHEVDGVNVYVRNDVKANEDKITIDHAKFLWNESLVVNGILV